MIASFTVNIFFESQPILTIVSSSFYGATIQRFPLKNEGRLQKWIQAVRRKNFSPNDSIRLCGLRFQPEDYTTSHVSKQLSLKNDAASLVFDYLKHLLPPPKSCQRVLERSSIPSTEIPASQFLFEAFFHIIGIFRSVQP